MYRKLLNKSNLPDCNINKILISVEKVERFQNSPKYMRARLHLHPSFFQGILQKTYLKKKFIILYFLKKINTII